MKPKHMVLGAFLSCLIWPGIEVQADSMFKEQHFRAFASDHRAYRKGDSLTVIITEIATATSTAKTKTGKDGSVSAFVRGQNNNYDLGTGLSNNFEGGGQTERSGKLVARITVTVQEIDPSGDLQVKGEQQIEVNNERQWISVAGRVRPQDITTDNIVLSSRIGNAKIEYIGKGPLAEQQEPGILTRILSWLKIL
jgi:flagellar L-ring protein precursor FlgH